MAGDRSNKMQPAEPFTFGIALISRRTAGDGDRVQDLLGLTQASLRAQTDQDFHVIAGHERPRLPDYLSRGLAARSGLTLLRIRAVAQGKGPRTHKGHQAGTQGVVV